MILLQWLGMNALIIYALAACELFPAAVQGFYWRLPENNLVIFLSLVLFQWVFIHTHGHMRTHTHTQNNCCLDGKRANETNIFSKHELIFLPIVEINDNSIDLVHCPID